MTRLRYSDAALTDIESILDYIGQESPAAAVGVGEGILDTCRLLEAYPELGERRDDLAPRLRLLPYRRFGIYYRIIGNKTAISIERVVHSARLLSSFDFG